MAPCPHRPRSPREEDCADWRWSPSAADLHACSPEARIRSLWTWSPMSSAWRRTTCCRPTMRPLRCEFAARLFHLYSHPRHSGASRTKKTSRIKVLTYGAFSRRHSPAASRSAREASELVRRRFCGTCRTRSRRTRSVQALTPSGSWPAWRREIDGTRTRSITRCGLAVA